MKRAIGIFGGVLILLVFLVPWAQAINIAEAEITGGAVVVVGNQAAKLATITWEGTAVTTSNKGGAFQFSTAILPLDCVGELSDGVETIDVVVGGCTTQQVVGGGVLKTGQTTAVTVDKNDGILGAVAVNDDGTLQLGATLNYQDNLNGTVTDLNTGLMWEKKLAAADASCTSGTQSSRDLRCVNNIYRWSGDGSKETIWDWLDDLNASSFAGHSDWRIPNVRELQSIVNYGAVSPSISAVFGPTSVSIYWSSTSWAGNPVGGLVVNFFDGDVFVFNKSDETANFFVRAVRGGS